MTEIKPYYKIIGKKEYASERVNGYSDLVNLLNSEAHSIKTQAHPMVEKRKGVYRLLTLKETLQLKIEAYNSGVNTEFWGSDFLFRENIDTCTHFYFEKSSRKFTVIPMLENVPSFNDFQDYSAWSWALFNGKVAPIRGYELEANDFNRRYVKDNVIKDIFIGALDGDEKTYNEYEKIMRAVIPSKTNTEKIPWRWMFVELPYKLPEYSFLKNAKVAGMPYSGFYTLHREGELRRPVGFDGNRFNAAGNLVDNANAVMLPGDYRTALLR